MTVGYAVFLGVFSIAAIIVLIARFRCEPLLVLFGVSVAVALAAGQGPAAGVASFEAGAGHALGHIAFIIAFGTMMGRIVAESGAADRIADTLIRLFGARNIHWAMTVIGLVVGLPVFFDVGFVLLAPLAFVAARRAGRPILMAALPLASSLSIAHALMPPHPAIMLAVQAYQANIGRTIMTGLLVMIPTAVVAGPLFARLVVPRLRMTGTSSLENQFLERDTSGTPPSFAVSLLSVLMPVLLILGGAMMQRVGSTDGPVARVGQVVGNTDIALALSTVFACVVLGLARGMKGKVLAYYLHSSLGPIAFVVLLVGAGGGFGRALIDTGISSVLTGVAVRMHASMLLMGWGLAAIVRLATGSATVAMSTAANILAPVFLQVGGTQPALLVLATGAGSVAFGPVTDPVFWQIKEYLGLSVTQTLLTWSVIETIISLMVLGSVCILSMF
ncbi:GntT/GntP/DsdX family permease [Gluconacetobacter tumulisoli]|uniref:Gluconate permease n=1 Tax=Gluconacetobacter tumulisoli TaxID=1286189 RepID=A0A7W4K6Z4_9PROT|nr:gluconate:H+ symporter [Gluconacetobacter tumulisoli]MBB2201522.1 hypothetical protein [Gluconacetobacter tumulisoli]